MRAKLLIFVMVVAALACVAVVLTSQYASGNVYSEYSSQRTDRMGTAAIYEALSKVYPGVSRNETPLQAFEGKNSELLILGFSPFELQPDDLDQLEAVAARGNRVVVGLDGGEFVYNLKRINEALWSKWHLKLIDLRGERLQPSGRFFFGRGAGTEWQLADMNVTRTFGKGSVTLMGTSWPFTNAALKENRDLNQINLALGNPVGRIVFDETHLGTVEQGTIMGLARRFRLHGVLAVALICAMLFIWQSSAPFPPERQAPGDADLQLAAASAGEGLRNLLAHHISPGAILSACVLEWRKDRGRLIAPDTLAQMEAIAAGKASPEERWREIQALLHKSK